MASGLPRFMKFSHFFVAQQGDAHRGVKFIEIDKCRLRRARQISHYITLGYSRAGSIPPQHVVDFFVWLFGLLRRCCRNEQQQQLFGKCNGLRPRRPTATISEFNVATVGVKSHERRVPLEQVGRHRCIPIFAELVDEVSLQHARLC